VRGIAVAVDWDSAEKIVPRSLESNFYRGDITDLVVRYALIPAVGTRRLSVIGLDGGLQPQVSFGGKLLVSLTARSTTTLSCASS
jgi:hypothetical protein